MRLTPPRSPPHARPGRRRHQYRHAGKVIGISAGIGIPLTIALMMASSAIGLELNPIQVMFGSSLAVMFGLFALWMPKKSAPKLSEGEIENLRHP